MPDLDIETTERLLRRASADLVARFSGVFGAETIDRYVHESYQALHHTSAITQFLPVLAARFAEERLVALAQATGAMAKPVPEVVFVCTQNAGRSQMAAALLGQLGGGRLHVRSAGSQPGERVEPLVIEVMSEVGIDLAEAFPKPLTDDVVQAADVVVTMGCGDACPIYPDKQYLDWKVADPRGQGLDEVRAIREEISAHVAQLLTQLPDADRRTPEDR